MYFKICHTKVYYQSPVGYVHAILTSSIITKNIIDNIRNLIMYLINKINQSKKR